MNFLTEKLGFEPELNQGLIASVVFHIGLFLFAWFGVPHLFEDDFIAQPLGIEAAIVSDISAAPKVDRVSTKVSEKSKQTQKAEPPKKEAKPAPAKANPKPASAPPPVAEEVAVAIPDKVKPKEEEKPKDKKPEDKPKDKPKKTEEKPKKPIKKDTSEIDSLLNNVLKEQAAEPPTEKPVKEPAPDTEETTGEETDLASEVPMSAGDKDGIRDQIQKIWNIGSAAGAPNLDQIVVELRIEMQPDGTVTRVTLLNNQADPHFRSLAESAIRAVQRASPLKLPPGKSWKTIKLVFRPSEIG
nr:TonB C-terminal domain-containing protein [uncultured Dongia sp.]